MSFREKEVVAFARLFFSFFLSVNFVCLCWLAFMDDMKARKQKGEEVCDMSGITGGGSCTHAVQ